MHATNNHSDIIFPLKFLLMVFPSDALGLVMGHVFVKEKPDSTAGGGAALQLPHSAFSHAALQTLYTVASISFVWGVNSNYLSST